ncbi:MAG: hypothetical protein C5B60_02455 [Chloroflexi bacterium]|nr:MAG: hypothetical protein C5B60_02455 [Chloroflexota bacterium]
MRKLFPALCFVLGACTAMPSGETYQQILGKLCLAPPSIMAPILTTPELQRAWQLICSQRGSVAPTPVTGG